MISDVAGLSKILSVFCRSQFMKLLLSVYHNDATSEKAIFDATFSSPYLGPSNLNVSSHR